MEQREQTWKRGEEEGEEEIPIVGRKKGVTSSEQTPTSSEHVRYEPPKPKIRRTMDMAPRGRQIMHLPIIRPKFPAKPVQQGTAVRLITAPLPIATPSSSNPRPLISLLDRTEFRDRSRMYVAPLAGKPRKPYYTELHEIRKEFGIPDKFDASRPFTMHGVSLAEKLKTLQRLRGENKFLRESIQKKTELCATRTSAIEQMQKTTEETIEHCQLLRTTLENVQANTQRMRDQME